MTGSRWVAGMAVVCVAAGCSGGDDAAPPVTEAAVVTTDASAGTEPTTTEAATTTAAPTTTVAPTTVPATTEPPPVSTEPTTDGTTPGFGDRIEATQAAIDAAEGAWAAFYRAADDPSNEALVGALSDYYSAEVLPSVLSSIERRRSEGTATRDNPDVPPSFEVDPISVVIDLDAGTATMLACHVNSHIVVSVGTGPNGDDEVVNDDVAIQVERRDVKLQDGRWKVSNAERADGEVLGIPCG